MAIMEEGCKNSEGQSREESISEKSNKGKNDLGLSYI